ncbi:MAG: hypothetical protein LBS69_05140 [Prevotellaceae bacterium]|jgi:hypothetical protein|nr:hypothetical protein [Prevotellaceae bacterium]
MKRKINTIIANLLFFSCFAQTDRKIFVADSLTRESIEYACIVFNDTAGGTYSNEHGYCYIPQNIEQIELSSIGYYSKTTELKQDIDTIFLSPKIYEISEAKVLPNREKRKPVELGYAKEKAMYGMGFPSGGEIAVYIHSINKENAYRLIKQIILQLKTNTPKGIRKLVNMELTDYISVLKINFYRITENNEIGELINTENIVFTSEVLKSKTKLDVSKYNIYMPENGIFVAVEWVGRIDTATGEIIKKTENILPLILVSRKIDNSISFAKRKFKRELNNKWEKSVIDTVFYKEFNNGYTPLISVVLE